jgi:hypothetical protein
MYDPEVFYRQNIKNHSRVNTPAVSCLERGLWIRLNSMHHDFSCVKPINILTGESYMLVNL